MEHFLLKAFWKLLTPLKSIIPRKVTHYEQTCILMIATTGVSSHSIYGKALENIAWFLTKQLFKKGIVRASKMFDYQVYNWKPNQTWKQNSDWMPHMGL